MIRKQDINEIEMKKYLRPLKGIAKELFLQLPQRSLMESLKQYNVVEVVVDEEFLGRRLACILPRRANKERNFKGYQKWKNCDYVIVLHPGRLIYWIEDLGHEMGHLAEWDNPLGKKNSVYNNLGRVLCRREMQGAEIFADAFMEMWVQKPENRTQARKLFFRLIKEGKVKIY